MTFSQVCSLRPTSVHRKKSIFAVKRHEQTIIAPLFAGMRGVGGVERVRQNREGLGRWNLNSPHEF